jgi:hypothetical protein
MKKRDKYHKKISHFWMATMMVAKKMSHTLGTYVISASHDKIFSSENISTDKNKAPIG